MTETSQNSQPFTPPPLPQSTKSGGNPTAKTPGSFVPPPLKSVPPKPPTVQAPPEHPRKKFRRGRWLLLLLLCCAVGWYALSTVSRLRAQREAEAALQQQYESAVQAAENGDYLSAYTTFHSLGDYSDSAAKAEKVRQQSLSHVSSGSVVLLGDYEQDGDRSNGSEVIAWNVLTVENGRALVISQDCLACQPYHTSNDLTLWEISSLRQWLNTTFLEDAFRAEEQARIVPTLISNAAGNGYWVDSGGDDTEDFIFLLSAGEAEQFFPSNETRQARSTAAAEGALPSGLAPENAYGGWWLRSPGYDYDRAAYVSPDGEIQTDGALVNSAYLFVRPAMWLSLDESAASPGESSVAQTPPAAITVNDFLLEDLGCTYEEMCEQYGPVTQSDFYEGGRWFRFAAMPDIVYFFVFNGECTAETPDNAAECYTLMTSADQLFTGLDGGVETDRLAQTLALDLERWHNADGYDEGTQFHSSFMYGGDILFITDQKTEDWIYPDDVVTVIGTHVGGPSFSAA